VWVCQHDETKTADRSDLKLRKVDAKSLPKFSGRRYVMLGFQMPWLKFALSGRFSAGKIASTLTAAARAIRAVAYFQA